MPERFSRESQIVVAMAGEMAEGLKVTLADGTRIYRPMGLTDSPGGAAVSGFSTVLIATGLLLTRVTILVRVALVVSLLAGMFCIYVCQVRSIFIITMVCEIAVFVIVGVQGEIKRLGSMIFIVPGTIALATIWAFAVGGDQVSDRFKTLTESSAGNVYYENRGFFVVSTIQDMQDYPIGAGLGRYGMIYQYFGDKSSQANTSLWAEIQPAAWLYDGGVLLIGLYYSLIVFCILQASKHCFSREEGVSILSPAVFGLNIGTLATTLGSVPFLGTAGTFFWLINAALACMASSQTSLKRSRSHR